MTICRAALMVLALGHFATPVGAQSKATKSKSPDTLCYEATLVDDNEKVIALCSRALTASETTRANRASSFSNRCLGYLRKGDFDTAIADCGEALRIDPKHAFALDNRGDAYRNKKQFDKALADYNAAIKSDATFISAYLNRAIAYENMGNLASARADLQTVIANKGERPIDKWARTMAEGHLKRLNDAAAKK